MRNTKTLDLCLIALFTAIISIVSQFNIPLPGGVPMTLQTFIVPVAGIVIGSRRGFMATLSYVILGAIGVPVFHGLTGGLGSIMGPTGGFIISFPVMALLAGMFYELAVTLSGEKTGNGKIAIYYGLIVAGLMAGTLFNYAVGVLWFMIVTHNTLGAALSACVIPFIPTTIIKIILVLILAPALRHTLYQARLIGTENAA